METPQQGSTLFSAILMLVATLVVIQLWLLAASVDAMLAHEFSVLLPTALASVVLFLMSGGLLLHVVAFDSKLRQWGRRD